MAEQNLTAPADEHKNQRWSYRRKADLCRDIDTGTTSLAKACEALGVGDDEVREWLRRWYAGGAAGLKMPPGLTREGKPGRRSRKEKVKQAAIVAVLAALIGERQ